jgi:hypothetical protein
VDEWLTIAFRTYCHCVWRHWILGKIYCQQIGYGSALVNAEIYLTDWRAARQGCTVIVPFREEMAKRHLKVAGDLGRVIFLVCYRRLYGETWAHMVRRSTIFATHSH